MPDRCVSAADRGGEALGVNIPQPFSSAISIRRYTYWAYAYWRQHCPA